MSDAKSLFKRTVFSIARDSTGCSFTTHKQDTELGASRLRSSGPVGKYRVSLLNAIARSAIAPRKQATIHGHQPQCALGSGAIRSPAHRDLTMFIASYDQMRVRFSMRYELIPK